MMEDQQVKSRERVAAHGEVFTAEREVRAMCDLVAEECARIDSRFLEPACGEGNFLAEILRRKLTVVRERYHRSSYDYERNAILALTSIYGVDIMEDNAKLCRERLYAIWDAQYTAACGKEACDAARSAARFILERNIVCGNALSMMCVDSQQCDKEDPIIFTEWTFPCNDARIKRREFRLDVLLKENPDGGFYEQPFDMFGSGEMRHENWMVDPVTEEIVPAPIKEYEAVYYRRLSSDG